MARLARLNVPHYPHHVIQRGHNGQPIALDESDSQCLADALREAGMRHGVALHAWVILRNEFQCIATPADLQALPRMMQDVGRSYVRHFNRAHLRSGTLWEGRYRNTVVDPQRLLTAMACLDMLPVWQGLCTDPELYAWSSCGFYTGHRHERGLQLPAQLWQLGNTPYAREMAYRALLHDPQLAREGEALQQAALHGWVKGSDAFVQALQQHTARRLQKKSAGRPVQSDKRPS